MKDERVNFPPSAERSRLSVELSPVVSSHLDHISEITGQTKAAIVAGALLDALPALLARADGLKVRYQQLNQGKRKRVNKMRFPTWRLASLRFCLLLRFWLLFRQVKRCPPIMSPSWFPVRPCDWMRPGRLMWLHAMKIGLPLSRK